MNGGSDFKDKCEGNPYSPDNNKACSPAITNRT